MKRGKTAKREARWVAVSGGFDPLHIGHIRYMREARKLGDRLVVIINNDNWLKNKKGYVFMPQKERAEIIRAFPFVDKVIMTDHKKNDPDRSVVRSLKKLRPAVFANGGDRFKDDIPEAIFCRQKEIAMRFNVGHGGKVQSSSWMMRDAVKGMARSVRPWGEFFDWDTGKLWHLKTISIRPGKRLSLQYHNRRAERWMLVEGEATAVIRADDQDLETPLVIGEIFLVEQGTKHRLTSKKGGKLVEISIGKFDENDIVRIEDDFGRHEK